MTTNNAAKNKQVAETFRTVARVYERDGHYQGLTYSCNAVGEAFRGKEGGFGPERAAYERTFGFSEGSVCANVTSNEDELWEMGHSEAVDIRVLLLCFAAALAETGDL